MRFLILILLAVNLCAIVDVRAVNACDASDGGLGVKRIVEIDTTAGPLYGAISLLEKEERFLEDKEVVLTFDDGPIPEITRPILNTLDEFCTKATFFPVGRQAIAYPKTVKDILRRGHSLGGHTWSHPRNLKKLPVKRAIDQIENGFAAIGISSGHAVVPFFRFPGLNDSKPLMQHLQDRGIATFTVDVVSDDSFLRDWRAIVKLTMERVREQNGGIILFHDIKRATTKALPHILKQLKEKGYEVVHLRAKKTLELLPDAKDRMQTRFEKLHGATKEKKSLSFPVNSAAALGQLKRQTYPKIPVKSLKAEPKARGRMIPEAMPLPVRKPSEN